MCEQDTYLYMSNFELELVCEQLELKNYEEQQKLMEECND